MKSFNQIFRLVLIVVITILASYYGVNKEAVSSNLKYLQTNQPGQYKVLQVDDGDTITIDMNGRSERVRLIGIDTPELHHPDKPIQCFAKEARQFTTQLIGNQPVRLQADPLDDNRDLYGRLLRYVYLADSKLLNTEIIKHGYGFAYTHFPFAKKAEVIALQAYARQKQLGLWSSCTIEATDRGLQTESL